MNSVRGTASKHGGAVERKDTYAFKRPKGGTEEQVNREKICAAGSRTIPHPKLRIIAEPLDIRRIMLHRIEVPAAAYWVTGLRYANALIKRPIQRGKGEIADYPAIGKMIVENKRVTVVRAAARSATKTR